MVTMHQNLTAVKTCNSHRPCSYYYGVCQQKYVCLKNTQTLIKISAKQSTDYRLARVLKTTPRGGDDSADVTTITTLHHAARVHAEVVSRL